MHMDCERETYARSLGSDASVALGSEEIDGRRGVLLGLIALPWLAVPVAGTAAALSKIGQACEWACRHREWIEMAVRSESWDDARLDAEMDRVDAVFARAVAEPSRSLADLSAKARLVLPDLVESMADVHDFPDGLLSVAVLRELAAFVPAREGGTL